MIRKKILLSLPLLLFLLPPFLSGNPGLYYPLIWLAVILLTPFFTVPLLAGEAAAGTDLLLLTGPQSDRRLLKNLLGNGSLSLGGLFILPLVIMALLLAAGGEDGGKILFVFPLIAGEILLATALGLAVSALCSRTAVAWFLTYLILLPLNFLSPLLPRWTDPLFEGYLPFAVLFLFPGTLLFLLEAAHTALAWKREAPGRKGKTFRLIPFLLLLAGFSFLPGGMDMTFSGQFRLNRVTARAIRSMEDPLYIRWYRTGNYRLYGDGLGGLEAFLFSLRLKGGLSVHYHRERLSDSEIEERGREYGWTVQTLDNRGEYESFYSVLEIEYRGKIETLPLVYNPLIAEEQLLAALQRLREGKRPTAGIIRGRSDRTGQNSWSVLNGALEEYFTLRDFTGKADILQTERPEALFVLGGRDLSAWEVSRIMDFVREGGSALVTLSPFILDPARTDMIVPDGDEPLLKELSQIGVYGGESFIIDPARGLYLASSQDGPPDFYPLWFNTDRGSLFDYTALWSVPLYYTGEGDPFWRIDSTDSAMLAGPLADISPATLNESPVGGRASYTTCLALPLGKGTLIVLSGDESLSDMMALADRSMGNSAWIQSLAFYLSGNEELLALRRQSMGAGK